MVVFLFGTIIAIAANAHICASNPTDTASVLEAMKPGACVERQEIYNVNK